RMISRRQILVLLSLPALAAAQKKMPRIGILSARSRSTPAQPDPYFDAFMGGMRELGYIEGKNILIEWRHADGKEDRLPALAAALVKLQPDLLVSHSTTGSLALKGATRTIPIVMASGNDPVASGIVKSLARPDANITGVSLVALDVSPKHIEWLKILL